MMPLFEYRCPVCTRHTEALRRVAEREDCPPCEHCGSATVKAYSVPVKPGPSFGKPMAHHTKGRRLSPAERERREHWNRTRLKQYAPEDKTPKPTIFNVEGP
jgi:putative FmdB family regulatory protein